MAKLYSMLSNINGKTETVATIIDYTMDKTVAENVKNYTLMLFVNTLESASFRVNFADQVSRRMIAEKHLIFAEEEVCIVDYETFTCIQDKIESMHQHFMIRELDEESDGEILQKIEEKIKISFASIKDFITKFEEKKFAIKNLTDAQLRVQPDHIPEKNLKRKPDLNIETNDQLKKSRIDEPKKVCIDLTDTTSTAKTIRKVPLSQKIERNFEKAKKHRLTAKTSDVSFNHYNRNVQFFKSKQLPEMNEEDLDFCFLSFLKVRDIKHTQKKCTDEFNILAEIYAVIKQHANEFNSFKYLVYSSLILVDFYLRHPAVPFNHEFVNGLVTGISKFIREHADLIKQEYGKAAYDTMIMYYLILVSTGNILNGYQCDKEFVDSKKTAEVCNFIDSLSYIYYQMGLRLNIQNKFTEANICFNEAIDTLCSQNILFNYARMIFVLEDYLSIVTSDDQKNISKIHKFLKDSSKQFSAKEEKKLKTINELKTAYKQKLRLNGSNHLKLFTENNNQECIIGEKVAQTEKNNGVSSP